LNIIQDKEITMEYLLSDLNLLEIKTGVSKKDEGSATFEIGPLSPGYGVTVGNSLRRVLLASLEGSAIKSVKIDGVDHEFGVLKGLKEDIVELILNLKMARFKLNADDSAKMSLSVKGPATVTTADFKQTSEVEVVSGDHYLCTLEKGGKLDLEIEVDKGRGYLPVEKRSEEKLPIGTILIDSIYTPVKKVRFDVENARVGSITNYDKLTVEIATDGSISPKQALSYAAKVLVEHFQVIVDSTDVPEKSLKASGKKSVKKKTSKSKK